MDIKQLITLIFATIVTIILMKIDKREQGENLVTKADNFVTKADYMFSYYSIWVFVVIGFYVTVFSKVILIKKIIVAMLLIAAGYITRRDLKDSKHKSDDEDEHILH